LNFRFAEFSEVRIAPVLHRKVPEEPTGPGPG
jgi:hypothetical protein